jgi:hypothetical protein
MAKKIDVLRGYAPDETGKMQPIYGELKPDDVEAWVKDDFRKAQALLQRNYPDANHNDYEQVKAMIEMLRVQIGQDWNSIEESITDFLKNQK